MNLLCIMQLPNRLAVQNCLLPPEFVMHEILSTIVSQFEALCNFKVLQLNKINVSVNHIAFWNAVIEIDLEIIGQ